MIFSPIPLPLVCNILALQIEVFSEKQRSSTIFSIISIYLVVYMFYLRLHALLTPLRSFTFFGGGGGGGRGERGVGGRRTRWIMRDDAQMANEVRSTNRRQSSNILQRNILQQPTNSWKLRRDKAPNLDPLSVTFAVIRSLALQNWSIQWGEVGRWEWMFMASSFFHESRWFSSLQAHWYVQCTTIPFWCWGLGRHKFSPDFRNSHFLCWPSQWSGLRPCHVRTQRTRGRRLALICFFGVHFVPSAKFPCRFTIVLCIKIPTFHIVSHPTFFLNHDLIFWSH